MICSLRVAEHQDHRVATQEKLADESVLVHWLRFLLPSMWCLCPHLTYVLKHHVGMAVEGLDTSEDLPVVAAVDENLRVVLDALLQNRERTDIEVVFVLWLLV